MPADAVSKRSGKTAAGWPSTLALALVGVFALSDAAVAQQAATAGQDWEEEYSWSLARGNGTPEAYQWFLDRYPSSRYRDLASREVVNAIVAGSFAAKADPPVSAATRNHRAPIEGALAGELLEQSDGTVRR